jgi:TfoX/Sxy family transcriptional regulator of competence genes
MKLNQDTIEKLENILNTAASALPKITSKKMFGCHALFVNENVFSLVWKHGRLGVKLPDEKVYQSLMDKDGSEPWRAGPMKMAHWVLVPESFHSKPAELKKWVQMAHDLVKNIEKKPNKAKSKTSKKAKA